MPDAREDCLIARRKNCQRSGSPSISLGTIIEQHWPEVLRSLRDDISPLYKPKLYTGDTLKPILLTESWSHLQADSEREDLRITIQEWAIRFRITEEWILDSALETLLIYCSRKRPQTWYWRYGAKGFHPRFEPSLEKNHWHPPRGGGPETWEQFKKRMQAQFRLQLAGYRTIVETRFGVGREERVHREAEWTARYQKGESVADIVQTIGIGRLADPEQAIFRAIDRFAKGIGLKLRRRARRSHRASVQRKP